MRFIAMWMVSWSGILYGTRIYGTPKTHKFFSKLSKLSKEFCKETFNIKLIFSSFKIKNYFSCKDPIPNDLNLP